MSDEDHKCDFQRYPGLYALICKGCHKELEISEPCAQMLEEYFPNITFTHFEIRRLEKILANLQDGGLIS